ncbi:MAG: RagB/SusD family nutrient uptake outer membrane protein [Bacteroidota bacterium]|nr:RagB/SusD family nutrient uptake outer membrane protein [Odoribacter sp.]MDP3642339.1 RagB/SusD family nutrient uptake outer membrane protein [Bacteroidota bacterium]
MKNINIRIASILSVLTLIIAPGCEKLLEEHPQSSISPTFFETPAGVLGGIAGVYSDLRNLWGTEGFGATCVAGTDDHLMGGSASGQTFYTYNGLNLDGMAGFWQIAYQDINTLNGVLEFGATIKLDDATRKSYLAQAKFLRGFYYFHLVQTFGDVPLHLEFVTDAKSSDSRAPLVEVYNAVIKDLTEAVAELPVIPTAPFTGKAATQATAKYLLAKVYLTRGWSSVAQTDDFQKAYSTAKDLIDNKATYGIDLWQDYADVNKDGNDYGKEALFVVDHNADPKFGDWSSQASGGKVNLMASLYRPNYPTMNANFPASGGSGVMVRDIANGRPYIRTRPNPNYIYNQAFAERANDSRYEKSFQTVWIANTASNVTTPRGTLVVGRDTAIWMPPYEVSAARRTAFKGILLTPKGENGGTAYTPVFFPALSKFNDPSRAHMNDPSDRPHILFRFAEVYMIAAEAAFKMNKLQDAADMINIIRRRAAYRSANSAAQNTAAATAMEIKPADVTIDFILDERTREFYGELLRWWDLVRTRQLLARVTKWNTEATPYIKDFHVLRPIPVTIQIDLVTEGPKFPQNPGY